MDETTTLALLALALLLVSHVLVRPEVYRRRRKPEPVAALLALAGHDRAVVERLIAAEVERGAPSRAHAAEAAAARLLRERSR